VALRLDKLGTGGRRIETCEKQRNLCGSKSGARYLAVGIFLYTTGHEAAPEAAGKRGRPLRCCSGKGEEV